MTSAPHLHTGVSVRVPAKVNLELRVGPPRPDGFHALATVYQGVSLYDTIEVFPAREWSVEIAGRTAAGVPADENNLALRAAQALHDVTGAGRPVRIMLSREGVYRGVGGRTLTEQRLAIGAPSRGGSSRAKG